MKKVVAGIFCGFALLVMIVFTFYNDDKAKKPSLVDKNDVEQQISLSKKSNKPEWDQGSNEMLIESVHFDNNHSIKEIIKEKNQSKIVSKLSELDSEIARLFLELDDVKVVEALDHQGLEELNERLSQFYINHDIVHKINNGGVHGDDRQAVSMLFAYTAKLRESISEKNIAVLTSKVNQLQEDINSGELPAPQPLALAQRQVIEQRVTESYQQRLLKREARRKAEDEQLAEEEIAFLSGK